MWRLGWRTCTASSRPWRIGEWGARARSGACAGLHRGCCTAGMQCKVVVVVSGVAPAVVHMHRQQPRCGILHLLISIII